MVKHTSRHLVHTPRHLVAALVTASVAAISACSEVTPPISGADQFQLPAPGTSVALDRDGNVLATREITHAPEFERVSWLTALFIERARMGSTGQRSPLLGHISTYSGPDPECSVNASDSQEELDEYRACLNGLLADLEYEVVVIEHFKESGDIHVHSGESPV